MCMLGCLTSTSSELFYHQRCGLVALRLGSALGLPSVASMLEPAVCPPSTGTRVPVLEANPSTSTSTGTSTATTTTTPAATAALASVVACTCSTRLPLGFQTVRYMQQLARRRTTLLTSPMRTLTTVPTVVSIITSRWTNPITWNVRLTIYLPPSMLEHVPVIQQHVLSLHKWGYKMVIYTLT